MLIKKFRSENLEKALADVKRELGAEALILSTETVRKVWWRKPEVIVTAAAKTNPPVKGESKAEYDSELLARLFPHRRDTDTAERPVPSPRKAAVTTAAPPAESTAPVPVMAPHAGTPEEEFVRYGFSTDSAREYTRQILTDYSRNDRRNAAIMSRVKSKLVASNLRTLGPEVFESRKTWAFIGPAGSGKTSLIVKLAHLHLAAGSKVALMSGDRRKLFGQKELAGYAKLLGAEFRAETSDRPASQITLIDTPSLIWRDAALVAEVDRITSDANTLLVLDASHRLEELLDAVEKSKRFAPVALAFTRLDQVSRIGVVHDVIRQAKLPLLGCSVSASLVSSFRFFDSTRLASYIIDFQNQRPAEMR